MAASDGWSMLMWAAARVAGVVTWLVASRDPPGLAGVPGAGPDGCQRPADPLT